MHGGCEALGDRRRTQQLLPCKRKIKRSTPLVGHLGTLLLFLSISVPILGQCDGMQGQIMTLAFSHSSGVPGKSTQRQNLEDSKLLAATHSKNPSKSGVSKAEGYIGRISALLPVTVTISIPIPVLAHSTFLSTVKDKKHNEFV